MKTVAIALHGIICAQIFCIPVQQTLAFPCEGQNAPTVGPSNFGISAAKLSAPIMVEVVGTGKRIIGS
jgi:hypothetical protein